MRDRDRVQRHEIVSLESRIQGVWSHLRTVGQRIDAVKDESNRGYREIIAAALNLTVIVEALRASAMEQAAERVWPGPYKPATEQRQAAMQGAGASGLAGPGLAGSRCSTCGRPF